MQLRNNSVSFDCLWWASAAFEFSLLAFHRLCNNCGFCTLLQLFSMAFRSHMNPPPLLYRLHWSDFRETVSVIYPGHSIIRLLLRPSELQYSTKRCQWYSARVMSLKPAELGKSSHWHQFESPGDQGLSLQILNVLPVSVWVWHSWTG